MVRRVFAFGAIMCGLTVFLLAVPGTSLDAVWRINPEAYHGFESLGNMAVVLMIVVGTACALARHDVGQTARFGHTGNQSRRRLL